jgi:CHAT domain-containing protein/tetratricopeptide (TPR) repeat protein
VGDDSTALRYQDQALHIAVETGNRDMEGMNLSNMANIYSDRLKQYGKAMDYYQKALLLVRETGDKRLETEFLGNIGHILMITGKTDRAESTFRNALDIARRIRHKGNEAWTLMNLGELYGTTGDLDRAMSYYGNSLAMGKRLSIPGIVLTSFLGMGTVYERQGHFGQALEQYRKAIGEIEGLRDRLSTDELKTFFMEYQFGAYEKIIHLLLVMHRAHPRQGYDRESFQYAESAKARSLLDIVYRANIFQNLDQVPRVFRETVVLNDNLLMKSYQSLSEAVNRDGREHDPNRISRIEQNIAALQSEKAGLLEQIRQNHPEYYDLTHPRLISADAVRRDHLDENQMLVEYFVGDEDVYVWTLTRQKMSFQSVGMGRSGLEKCLARISPLFLRERKDPSAAMDHRWANIQNSALHRLYKTMLQVPAGNDLTQCGEILIVADDLLNYFPFEMLVTGIQGKKARYLIEDHPLSYFYSSSFLDRGPRSGSDAGRNLIAFGNPYFRRTWKDKIRNPAGWFKSDKAVLRNETFQPLPSAEREVKAISAYFPNSLVCTGKNATEERFKKLAGEYRYIHLATHFITSDLQPMLSKVVLSQARREGEDGYLQMYEVYNLSLKAELAILSGCNTGLGELHRGEGLIGISRAFFYAGASALVVSLWPVEDESTALLMKSFYGHLGTGLNKSRALQQAKIDLIRSTDTKRDPFYWGPFVLIEGGR